jgi:hypothetical protein
MIYTLIAEMVANSFTKSLMCALLWHFNLDMGLNGAYIIKSQGMLRWTTLVDLASSIDQVDLEHLICFR